MTPDEVARVLAAAAARDNRTVGPVDVMAWLEDIGDLDPTDALAAVSRHYRTTTDRLMPAHVRRLAHEIGQERRKAARLAREAEAKAIEAADPTRRNRSADVAALIERVRAALPEGDPDKLRRSEWVEADKRRARQEQAEPNPHYDPTAVPDLTDPVWGPSH